MPDFLLELLSEEIPARMQAKAQQDLARLFSEQLSTAGLAAASIETYATPRRLALVARGLPPETAPVREERKGPRADAPAQAVEGFLRSTGLTRDQIEVREDKKGGHVLFAVVEKPGRATASVLAEAIPAIIRAFPWPKSMRWGAASAAAESLRWVRPLQGIVALLGEEIVEVEIAGVKSGAATVGHRFHHPGIITIGSAGDYAEKLRACHVIIGPAERRRLIAEGAAAAAAAAGLTLVEDEGLLQENAGLTEWPVPLLGSFDPVFLQVPREVIQLTMRTNQKYFACVKSSPSSLGEGERAREQAPGEPATGEPKAGGGATPPSALRAATSPSKLGEDQLAPNFICTANLEASDGGAAIVAGNERVLSARLADAKFFWEQDVKVPLEAQAAKLGQIVFHEKLGTVADKVDRVASLARWLVEEGIVGSSPAKAGAQTSAQLDPGLRRGTEGEGPTPSTDPRHSRESGNPASPSPNSASADPSQDQRDSRVRGNDAELANLAERAARLCKADLVTGMVGEFPELQGIIGGHLARAQGEPDAVADAIRDHYKPVGQGDEVPTAPVTVAVSLADKLDSLVNLFAAGEVPTGSRDPYAQRRAALAIINTILANELRLPLMGTIIEALAPEDLSISLLDEARPHDVDEDYVSQLFGREQAQDPILRAAVVASHRILMFIANRYFHQLRAEGHRHDFIQAILEQGSDDFVLMLRLGKALQAFVETPEGADLLVGYKRAANILKKEGWNPSSYRGEGRLAEGERGEGLVGEGQSLTLPPGSAGRAPPASGEDSPRLSSARPGDGRPDAPLQGEGQSANTPLSYTPEKEEAQLIAALDSAAPRAAEAVAAEDFEAAMAALASLRAPVDAFFDKVTVNDPDPAKREARLALLARMRDAVHAVADFSRIEG